MLWWCDNWTCILSDLTIQRARDIIVVTIYTKIAVHTVTVLIVIDASQ